MTDDISALHGEIRDLVREMGNLTTELKHNTKSHEKLTEQMESVLPRLQTVEMEVQSIKDDRARKQRNDDIFWLWVKRALALAVATALFGMYLDYVA